VPEIIGALLVFDVLVQFMSRPFTLGLLGEEVVGETDREVPLVAQLLDDGVILRIILKAAARVDRAGNAEAIELAHEVPRRVDLILERQLWPLASVA